MDGKEIRLLSGKNYLFQNTERKDIDGRDVRVTTTGATRASIFFADTSDAFRISGIRKDTVTIDGALASGTDTLLVDDASNIRVGYLIELRSNKAWYYDDAKLQPKGELHYVRKVSSDTVWTRHVTFDSYSASEDVDVIVYEPITVQIAGVNFIYPLNDDQANGIALEARYWGPGSRITNCSIQESDLTGLQLTSCFNIRIDNSDIVGCDKQGNGYGIHDQGGYGSIIENNYFYGNRSGIDAGNYMSRSNKFTNNIVNASNLENDSTRALGLHQLAEGWLIEGNVIESAYYGIIDRGVNNVIKGNKFHSIGAVVISKNGGGSFTVMDNIYNSQLDKREDVGPVSLEAQQANTFVTITRNADLSDTSFYSIKNNVANGISKHFISIEDSIYNLELANNMVRFNTSGNPVLVLSGTANAPVKNSAIIDNVVFAPSGNYTPFANVDIDESTLVRLFEDSKIAIGNVTAMDSIFNVKGGASFSGGIHVSGEFKSGMLQSGGILFAGSDGIIENDYANLYYNSASRRLGVQVNSPEAALHVAEGTEARLLFGDNGPNSNPQLRNLIELTLPTSIRSDLVIPVASKLISNE
jgi:hypothetical protein